MIDPSAAISYLDENRTVLIDRLLQLVRIASVSTSPQHAGDCRRAAAWLAEHLAGIGLQSEVAETAGLPAVLAHCPATEPDAPTVLLYGHYDVQPPEPLDPWLCPPFEAEVRSTDASGNPVAGGVLIARGAADNKGQVMAMLAGLEALLRTGGQLPVNVKVLIEGEEEIGSVHLADFIRTRAGELAADAVVLADSEMIHPHQPAIVYSTRGLVYATVTVRGPRHDVHSGGFGGVVANPANGLARIIAALHDRTGRVTLRGFYDGVPPVSHSQRAELAALGVSESDVSAEAGVTSLGGGECGRHFLERCWLRPTCDCNGLSSGYQGPGSKTIIPASAMAKISFRLVGRQDPDRVAEAFRRHVADHCPAGLSAEVTFCAGARPYQANRDAPAFTAAAQAVRLATDAEPAWIGGGGTLPVLADFKDILQADSLLLGLARPDCNAHGPNEQFDLADFHTGARIAAALLAGLAPGEES